MGINALPKDILGQSFTALSLFAYFYHFYYAPMEHPVCPAFSLSLSVGQQFYQVLATQRVS